MTKILNRTFYVLALIVMFVLPVFFLTACDNNISVEKVELNVTTYEMKVGDNFLLTATVTPKDAINQKVEWITSDETVATVDKNGKVHAIKVGTITITVTTEDSGKTATCEITVTPASVDSVSFYNNRINLIVEEVQWLRVNIYPEYAGNKNVTFKSDNTSVATVDKDGKVTGVGAGNTTITVTTEDGNKTATAIVNVEKAHVELAGSSTKYDSVTEVLRALDENNLYNSSGATVKVYGKIVEPANEIVISGKKITFVDCSNSNFSQLTASSAYVDGVTNFFKIIGGSDVTFENLTINADGQNSKVRALYVENSNLILDRTTVTGGMYTQSQSSDGSYKVVGEAKSTGIKLTGSATATIKNSTITGNKMVCTGGDYGYINRNDVFYAQDLWMGSQTLVVIENSTIGYAFKNANSYTREEATNGEESSYVIVKGAETVIDSLFLEYDTREKENGREITVPEGKVLYYDGDIDLVIASNIEGGEETSVMNPEKGKMYVGGNANPLDLPQNLPNA